MAVTGLLLWPLLTHRGYPFARDLVFTPRLPLRAETLGLGPSSPRSAPLDAIVGVLSLVADGAILGHVLVPLGLLLAGWGAHRMVGTLGWPARTAIAGLAVWNPYTVERLALGQWPLLFGYAALFWLVALLSGSEDAPRVGASAPWLGVAAVTPTGAVLAGAVALALGVRRGNARRTACLGMIVLLVQLPWLVPALLSAAARTSDPVGVQAFAARAEGAGPALWSLIGLGGIWDSFSVPASRAGLLGSTTSALVLSCIVVSAGSVRLRRRLPPRLLVVGAASITVAAVSSLPLGSRLIGELTGTVPGFGLLRDAQKWLAAFVVLALAAIALCIDASIRRLEPVATSFAVGASVIAVTAPWLLLPDGSTIVHRVVRPQNYPPGLEEVARVVASRPAPVVSLPWGLYRRYSWATDYATYDPASRWFDAPVVTDDSLRVGTTTIRGENPLAADVGRLLEGPDAGKVAALGRIGIGYAVVYRGTSGDGAARDLLDSTPGATRLVDTTWVTLYQLPDLAGDGGPASVSVDSWRVILVVLGDLTALAVVVTAPWRSRWRRRTTTSATLA
jgi:hypothetical protein